MSRTVTITLTDEVYRRLEARCGADQIGSFVEQLLRPYGITDEELRAGYGAMAADAVREAEALAWIESHPNDGLDDDEDWGPLRSAN